MSTMRLTLRQLFPSLRPFRSWFGIGIVAIVASTLIEVGLPIVLGRGVDVAISTGGESSQLFRIAGLYLLLILVKTGTESLQAFSFQRAGEGVTDQLRKDLFAKILSLPVPYFDKNPTGRLLTRVVNDIKSLSELFTASFSVIALDVMIILGTIVAMFWVHPKLAAAVLFSFPLVFVVIHVYGTRLAKAYREVRARLSEINAFLGENIGAIGTVQRLGAEQGRADKFAAIVEAHRVAQMGTLQVFARVQPLINTLNGLAMGILLGLGGYWVIRGELRLGILVAFFGYVRNLFQPIRDLVEKYNTFLSSITSAERVVGILDEPSERDEALPSASMLLHSECEIEFDRVSFTYPLRAQSALQEVSFRVAAGTSTAVVGATGSGKSTLVRLLLKFYDIDRGEIRFARRPLKEWTRKDLRRQIGVIHQEIYLFQGTLRENLTLGRMELSDEYLREKCVQAQLWPLIEIRGGLDFQVLEGGTNLSVGERQLLSFARILVFDPKVLILDEATSNIDRELERRLIVAMREVMANRTSLVIAHRLATISACNQILVFEKGHLVERGSYQELLNAHGVFHRFHEIYSHS